MHNSVNICSKSPRISIFFTSSPKWRINIRVNLICFTDLINRIVSSRLREPIFPWCVDIWVRGERPRIGLRHRDWLVLFFKLGATFSRLFGRMHSVSCLVLLWHVLDKDENREGESSAVRSRARWNEGGYDVEDECPLREGAKK